MALKINLKEVNMQAHPKFEGVKIGYVSTKERHPELSIVILEIIPGIQIPTHTHEREIDSIFVLEGEGEIFLNNEWTNIKAGDIIVVGTNELHGVKSTGDIPLKAYIVHAPALW
jgi:quercetin dioxygenase-like cupin family protein